MSAPTCVSCNKPFPANGELASLPEGKRIAFDPGQRRVWRICTKCGEWNLLGAEAAGAALPELSARDPKPSTSVRSTRISGDLELLRIDDLSKVEVADLVMAEQRDGLSKAARFAPFAPLAVVAVYAISWLITPLFVEDGGGAFPALLDIALYAGSAGLVNLPRIVKRIRYRAGVPKRLWIGVLASQICLSIVLWRMEYGMVMAKFMYLGILPVMILSSVVPWHRLLRGLLPHRLLDAGLMEDWDATGIRWSVVPPLLSLRPLGQEWVSGEESARVLESVITFHVIGRINPEGVQHAHALAASLGPSGVLQTLDEWRRDRGDTLTLGDIPAVYLVALQLAFSGEKEASRKALSAHEKLLEAGAVAQEAEALDRLPQGS